MRNGYFCGECAYYEKIILRGSPLKGKEIFKSTIQCVAPVPAQAVNDIALMWLRQNEMFVCVNFTRSKAFVASRRQQ